jgi:hypothetical protein
VHARELDIFVPGKAFNMLVEPDAKDRVADAVLCILCTYCAGATTNADVCIINLSRWAAVHIVNLWGASLLALLQGLSFG